MKMVNKNKIFVFIYLFFLIGFFSLIPGIVNSVDLAEEPNCYRFTRGYYDKNNNWRPIETGIACFPGLVSCGVRICINEQWVEFDPEGHPADGQHVPGWHCPTAPIPIVPDEEVRHHCTICHLFIMFFAVISFVFTTLVPFLAVIILAIAGAMIALARGDPESIKKGWTTIRSVIIGLLLVYGAFIITSAFFSVLGFIQWDGFDNNLFSVQGCETIRIIVEP